MALLITPLTPVVMVRTMMTKHRGPLRLRAAALWGQDGRCIKAIVSILPIRNMRRILLLLLQLLRQFNRARVRILLFLAVRSRQVVQFPGHVQLPQIAPRLTFSGTTISVIT